MEMEMPFFFSRPLQARRSCARSYWIARIRYQLQLPFWKFGTLLMCKEGLVLIFRTSWGELPSFDPKDGWKAAVVLWSSHTQYIKSQFDVE